MAPLPSSSVELPPLRGFFTSSRWRRKAGERACCWFGERGRGGWLDLGQRDCHKQFACTFICNCCLKLDTIQIMVATTEIIWSLNISGDWFSSQCTVTMPSSSIVTSPFNPVPTPGAQYCPGARQRICGEQRQCISGEQRRCICGERQRRRIPRTDNASFSAQLPFPSRRLFNSQHFNFQFFSRFNSFVSPTLLPPPPSQQQGESKRPQRHPCPLPGALSWQVKLARKKTTILQIRFSKRYFLLKDDMSKTSWMSGTHHLNSRSLYFPGHLCNWKGQFESANCSHAHLSPSWWWWNW